MQNFNFNVSKYAFGACIRHSNIYFVLIYLWKRDEQKNSHSLAMKKKKKLHRYTPANWIATTSTNDDSHQHSFPGEKDTYTKFEEKKNVAHSLRCIGRCIHFTIIRFRCSMFSTSSCLVVHCHVLNIAGARCYCYALSTCILTDCCSSQVRTKKTFVL